MVYPPLRRCRGIYNPGGGQATHRLGTRGGNSGDGVYDDDKGTTIDDAMCCFEVKAMWWCGVSGRDYCHGGGAHSSGGVVAAADMQWCW